MIILFYFFFILQVASLYFFQTSSIIDPIIYGYIVLDAILLICLLGKKLKGNIILCVSLSLVIRLCILVYMQITGLKLSLDWNNFLCATINYMNGLTDNPGMYPRILSFFFTNSGFNCNFMLMPIALNIFCSIVNIYVIYLIFQYLEINNKIKIFFICVLSFLPIQMGYSLEMIRETLPTLFISLSLLFFIKWFFTNKIKYILLAFFCTFVACSFHAGCIAVTFGYAYTFAFYDFKRSIFNISLKKILFYIPVIILFAGFLIMNSDIFLGKLSDVTDIASLEAELEGWGSVRGGSVYLTWLKGASLPVQIIFFPLKAFYFLFSPIIFDIRGLQDLFVLFFDASIFIVAILCYLKIKKNIHDKRVRLFVSILFLTLCIIACIFGQGTTTTGTAMRHRNKFIAFPIVLIATSYTYANARTKKNNYLLVNYDKTKN